MLQLSQRGHVLVQSTFQDRLRPRPRQMELGEVARPVGQLNLFADEIMVEVLDDLVGHPGDEVEPKRLAIVVQQVIDQEVGNDPCLGGRQEGLAAGANSQVLDVVGAQVVQEAAGVGAGQLHLAPVRNVEEGHASARLPVLARGIGCIRERCAFRHGEYPSR